MHNYPHYFPRRCGDDRLDVASVLHAGLLGQPDRIVLSFDGDAWPAARLCQRVAVMQHWLDGQGIVAGNRVAMMLKNSPDHIALIYALILAGVVWVPINTKLKSTGLQYLMDHCRPELAVLEAEFQPVWTEAAAMARHQCPAVQMPAVDMSAHAPAMQRVPTSPADILCLIYTSGTTGAPKGVQFTHRMMRIASEAALRVADARDGDRLFLWEPLCHIGGAQMLMAPFLVDVQVHVVAAFSASRFWQQVTTARATQLHYLGGILEILLRLPASTVPPHHNLRVAWGAGLNVQAWDSVRHTLGVELRECYGMTEGSSFATLNAKGKPGSIGRPLPWISLELLDDKGREVECGQHGQIVLSSDVEGVFLPAYLDNPEATAQTLRGGRLYTGDYARRDADGDLYFVGRGTDSMRVRGENVSAWEVERVMALHPAVESVAAVGVTSDIGEQEILLYVQFREPSSDAFAELAHWAQSRLASFQLPRYYRSVERFELTPSERIRKHLLSRNLADAWDSTRGAAVAA